MIYIEKIKNLRKKSERTDYPYNIPSLRLLDELTFTTDVTFIVGKNGSGKSTLIEAIAINAGFNPEGGSRNMNFKTRDTHSMLFEDLRLTRTYNRNKDGYFLRAESLYNLASAIDEIGSNIQAHYGNKSLHENSHGESFIQVFTNRLFGNGLYVFDEPEAALSLKSLFALLIRMKELVDQNSQFIIATHSPVLMAYPGATIYEISEAGMRHVEYENTDQYQLTKYFINNYKGMISELLGPTTNEMNR